MSEQAMSSEPDLIARREAVQKIASALEEYGDLAAFREWTPERSEQYCGRRESGWYYIDGAINIERFADAILTTLEATVRDNCQICLGAKGGVPGNENRLPTNDGYVVACDYCTVMVQSLTAAHPKPEPVETQPEACRSPVSEKRQLLLSRQIADQVVQKSGQALNARFWDVAQKAAYLALTPSPQPQAPSEEVVRRAIAHASKYDTPTEGDPRRRFTQAQMEIALRRFATDTHPIAGGGE